ncbi:molecular chaperone Tir [Leptolyngbya sp. 'hensonii']|uniref:AAA-like domain-containing protein n=1 Tax=Leptolyngbya sp. 'hensonii' TaxID=1922337 RepID=UPI00095013D9|nr:AAA-like domain-containing protein [Leptolyngbya sp. 'hensonii']OLP20350.1 molecular chaperone Tir [Leptolyngbya sp. 'hensonii']
MNPIDNVVRPLNLRGSIVLAAIVFTDVEAFTAKMLADEQHALALIERDFQRMGELCDRFEGQVLKSLGDGLLMYFVSAEKAVSCAIEIQLAFAEMALNLPIRDILHHRIGIHLGDVEFTGSDVMGSGVNLAARLQREAPARGICLSQTVYEVVKGRLPRPAMFMGRRQLKGIPEPVPVYEIAPPYPIETVSRKIFISYRSQNPDFGLAQQFYAALTEAGHEAFLAGESIRLGENWPQRIEAELRQSDYLLLLLSARSATSEMVMEEVRRAKDLQEQHPEGKPVILPIRVNFPLGMPLTYDLHHYLDQIQQREWQSDADTPALLAEVLQLITNGPTQPVSGQPSLPSPSPASDRPTPAAEPELPTGQVNLASPFYMERPPIEIRCYQEITRAGALVRIRAPRQMGKTSLMVRILQQAADQGYRTIPLNFQLADSKILADLDRFLQWFCANIALELNLPDLLSEKWNRVFGSKVACKAYFENYLLPQSQAPLVLGLDEVDRIFLHPELAGDFFGLLRAWHEEAKNREIWKKLRLIVVHSTEVYIPIDINQSPFNVGLPIELAEFDTEQVLALAHRHHLTWTWEDVQGLMHLVGGHPYLVRLALYAIARQETTLEQLVATAAGETGLYGDHLRRHLWNLQQHPELAAAARQVFSTDGPTQLEAIPGFKLHSMGLVRLQGHEARARCHLYRQYFSPRLENLPAKSAGEML